MYNITKCKKHEIGFTGKTIEFRRDYQILSALAEKVDSNRLKCKRSLFCNPKFLWIYDRNGRETDFIFRTFSNVICLTLLGPRGKTSMCFQICVKLPRMPCQVDCMCSSFPFFLVSTRKWTWGNDEFSAGENRCLNFECCFFTRQTFFETREARKSMYFFCIMYRMNREFVNDLESKRLLDKS